MKNKSNLREKEKQPVSSLKDKIQVEKISDMVDDMKGKESHEEEAANS